MKAKRFMSRHILNKKIYPPPTTEYNENFHNTPTQERMLNKTGKINTANIELMYICNSNNNTLQKWHKLPLYQKEQEIIHRKLW